MQMNTLIKGLNQETRLRQHVLWFIRLRWVAAALSGGLLVVAASVGHILPHESLLPLAGGVTLVTLSNLGFAFWLRHTTGPLKRQIAVQVTSDLIILTTILHFSGGLENPLYILYSFHVIIACILLGHKESYLFTLMACGLFALLVFGEFFHLLPHYTVHLFPHGEHAAGHAAHDQLYVFSRFFAFVGILLGTAYFTNLIMAHLRESEADLEGMARTAMAEHQQLESVINAVDAGMVLLDRDLRVQWFNSQVRDWFNWTQQQQKLPWATTGGQEHDGQNPDIVERALHTGRMQEAEWEWDHGRFFLLIASPIHDQEGAVTQIALLIQDVTARKAIEAQMIHTEKMAVLGRMSAGIVHEIGNPLSSLSTRLRLLENRREEEFVSESVHLLQGQIDRIQRIVRGVAQFSQLTREEWAPCRIGSIVRETLDILRMDRRVKDIEIKTEFAEDLPETMGVPDRLTQVFLNIALNALEAMEGKGTLSVRTQQRNGEIEAHFADTGPGLNQEEQEKIFDPFFTTKKEGSGLGLFISYSITNAHGGRIEVESEPGAGTIFKVVLPVRVSASVTTEGIQA